MHTYYCSTIQSVYHDWFWVDIRNVNASPKRPQRIIGRRRRYNDTTIPPLDFRSNHWASQFNHTEVQNGSRESSRGDSSRLDERDR